eukprot:15485367-Alexandrium_andersonii.AAC.1
MRKSAPPRVRQGDSARAEPLVLVAVAWTVTQMPPEMMTSPPLPMGLRWSSEFKKQQFTGVESIVQATLENTRLLQ